MLAHSSYSLVHQESSYRCSQKIYDICQVPVLRLKLTHPAHFEHVNIISSEREESPHYKGLFQPNLWYTSRKCSLNCLTSSGSVECHKTTILVCRSSRCWHRIKNCTDGQMLNSEITNLEQNSTNFSRYSNKCICINNFVRVPLVCRRKCSSPASSSAT